MSRDPNPLVSSDSWATMVDSPWASVWALGSWGLRRLGAPFLEACMTAAGRSLVIPGKRKWQGASVGAPASLSDRNVPRVLHVNTGPFVWMFNLP